MWTGVDSFPDLEAGDNTTLLGLCPRAEWENIKQGPPSGWLTQWRLQWCVCPFLLQGSLSHPLSCLSRKSVKIHVHWMCLKTSEQGFLAGSVVKHLPANAGDVGSILSPASCPQSRPPTIASEFWVQHAWTWRAVWPAWRKVGWRFGLSLDGKLAALSLGGTWALGADTPLSIAGRLWLCPGWPHPRRNQREQSKGKPEHLGVWVGVWSVKATVPQSNLLLRPLQVDGEKRG